jgi:hypothetical protein
MRTANLSIGPTTKYLMLYKAKMQRVKKSVSGVTTVRTTKNGRSYMLTKLEKLRLKDLMRSLVSISTDHSTLSLNFHSTELLRPQVPTMSSSRDGETTGSDNNSTSMKSQRLLDLNNGRTTLLKSKATVEATTSE